MVKTGLSDALGWSGTLPAGQERAKAKTPFQREKETVTVEKPVAAWAEVITVLQVVVTHAQAATTRDDDVRLLYEYCKGIIIRTHNIIITVGAYSRSFFILRRRRDFNGSTRFLGWHEAACVHKRIIASV